MKSISISMVSYIDYQTEYQDFGKFLNNFTPLLYKDKSYEHENELRVICHELNAYGIKVAIEKISGQLQTHFKYNEQLLEQALQYGGIYIPVDLDVLIENIYIHPKAASWYRELVEEVTQKYGIDTACIKNSYLKR